MLDTSGVTLSRSQGVKTGVSIKFICGVMYYPPSPQQPRCIEQVYTQNQLSWGGGGASCCGVIAGHFRGATTRLLLLCVVYRMSLRGRMLPSITLSRDIHSHVETSFTLIHQTPWWFINIMKTIFVWQWTLLSQGRRRLRTGHWMARNFYSLRLPRAGGDQNIINSRSPSIYIVSWVRVPVSAVSPSSN